MKNALLALLNKTPSALYHAALGQFVPVFMLHRIANEANQFKGHDKAHLRWCLDYVRREGFAPLSLPELINCISAGRPLPKKAVVFTIDDGFADNIVDAGAIFSEFDIPLTCFVITGFIDGEIWPWDDQVTYALSATTKNTLTFALPDETPFTVDMSLRSTMAEVNRLREVLKKTSQSSLYPWLHQVFYPACEVSVPAAAPTAYQPATWDDIRKFAASGHIAAPHTLTHRILSALTEDEAKAEIAGSWQRLQTQVPQASGVFAYPTGRPADFSMRDMRLAKEAGLTGAVTTVTDYARPGQDIFALSRFSLPSSRFDFMQYIGVMEALKMKLRG